MKSEDRLMSDQSMVHQRLEILAERDPEFTVFGSESHRYRLGPPLSEKRVTGFEREMGIELPGDYRSFVTTVGNGGAGPGYGLTPLETAVGYVRRQDERSRQGLRSEGSSAAQAFPLSSPVLGPEGLDVYSGPDFTGVISLGGYGCGIDPHLVVSGAERGHVWILDLASDGGVYPFALVETGHLHDEARGYPSTFEDMVFATRMSFSEWYEDWLESTERQLASDVTVRDP
jgi:hypothetical protein